MQFGLRIGPVKPEGPALRLKNRYVQDDKIVQWLNCTTTSDLLTLRLAQGREAFGGAVLKSSDLPRGMLKFFHLPDRMCLAINTICPVW